MRDIGDKIVRYLNSRPVVHGLPAFLAAFWNRLPESAIFGGLIRDFGLDADNRFESDIDIVSSASAQEIAGALRGIDIHLNRYGGYRFFVGRRLFDVWSLQDTWAVRVGLVRATELADLRRTTFFNLDAVLLDFREKSVTAYDAFEDDISCRFLDINLLEHPDPKAMAQRAIKMALGKNLALSHRLVEFIVSQVHESRIGSMRLSTDVTQRLFEYLDRESTESFRYCHQLSLWPERAEDFIGLR